MRTRILLAAILAVLAAPVAAQPPNCATLPVPVRVVVADTKGVAVCTTPKGSILRREKPDAKWQIVDQKETLKAGDLLIGLPGAALESNNKAVSLTFLTDFGDSPFPVVECGVILHESKDFDLEVTLDRGRANFTNIKAQGAAKVRVHVHDQVIDLTLKEPKTEVSMELYGRWAPGARFKMEPGPKDVPIANLVVLVLHGSATLKQGMRVIEMAEPPGAALIQWDNEGGFDAGATHLDKPPHWATPDPDSPRAKRIKKISGRYFEMAKTKTIEQILEDFIASDDPDYHLVFVNVCAATDHLDLLAPVMVQPKYAALWDPAIVALRNWIGRAPGQDKKLYKMLIDVGKFKPVDAETTVQLLHSFGEDDLARPETYETLIDYMEGDRILIRALANWHLMRLVPQGQEFKFNPAGDKKDRDEAIKKWRKLIPAGKLPPKKDQ